MLEKYTQDQLDILKIVITFVGTGASLFFGIIGTTFETHTEIIKRKNGREIKKRHPTIWLWISIIGLIISSIISSSMLLVDKENDKKKSISEANYKARYKVHQDSIAAKLADSLSGSIKLTKEFKSNSELVLGLIDSNAKEQKNNLIKQATLLDRTSTQISHPFFPFTMRAIVLIKQKFKNNEKQTEWNNLIQFLIKNKSQINLPRDFTCYVVDSVVKNISFGTDTPIDPSKFNDSETAFNDYDIHFNQLIEQVYWSVLPQLTFYVTQKPANHSETKALSELFSFTCGSGLLDPNYNKLDLVVRGSNCKISCNIDCETNDLNIMYYGPITSFFSESNFASLFEEKNGSIGIALVSKENINASLNRGELFCGYMPEKIDNIKFNLLSSGKNAYGELIKTYITSISDALNHHPK